MWHAWVRGGVFTVLVWKPDGKRPDLGIGKIKLDLKEIGIDGAILIRLAQNRVQWRAFLNMVMNLQFP
jgi:hypothetical protein